MNDKSKNTLVCGTANCIRSHFSVNAYHTSDTHPHKQTQSDTINYLFHTLMWFPIIYIYFYIVIFICTDLL